MMRLRGWGAVRPHAPFTGENFEFFSRAGERPGLLGRWFGVVECAGRTSDQGQSQDERQKHIDQRFHLGPPDTLNIHPHHPGSNPRHAALSAVL